ncbi:dicarboxylate/amino acid:cation symporter [Sphingomonas mesophila]|uniref:dicarboxylate/amino acid:cation symporter n=1 Tax=Sphingomonas mesophila TaxID=2303576 RepID=UPI000E56FF13|nr:cation:dicarboxylase symporter family transporter [Sphingomonas mesophila]
MTETTKTRVIGAGNGWRILAALVVGIAAGVLVSASGDGWRDPAVRWAGAIGGIWLDALKVTVIPLIVALLVSGIVGGARAAAGGGVAGRSILWFVVVLTLSAAFGGLAMPALLSFFPLPEQSAEALRAGLAGVDKAATAASVPTALDFARSIVPSNVLAAAVNDQILPLTLFTAAFALAVTRIDKPRRDDLVGFFQGIEQAMLVMIGWVLWIAPVGVFGLAFALGAGAGAAAFGAILHYVALVMLVGLGVTAAGYGIAILFAGWRLRDFARAMVPPQAVAISTQSSLASLPAMVGAARRLGVPETNSDVTLPLAVALFRATGPAMNMAVAVYVAYWLGIDLAPWQLFAGIAMASIASYWAVSLPGSISFVTSIAPIALAMGLPVEPLAILIAVETFPDIVRTLGNVTMDVAVTGAVSRKADPQD